MGNQAEMLHPGIAMVDRISKVGKMPANKHICHASGISSYHHHNRIFDLRAGAGASSTSVGPFPGNWLAARIADLTPDLQVLLS